MHNIKNKGFTLLELLVVMVIIGLLVSYVGPRYFNQLSQSEVKVAKAQINGFRKALAGLNALLVAPQGSTKWHGPYLQKAIPSDPWDHPYLYRIPGEKTEYDLISYGADGKLGGVDENADIAD